jgi:formate hydrogenlyase subunit 4
MIDAIVHVALLFALPPLVLGVINKTKAIAGGRRGPPILQPYFDLGKLLRKGAVYSRTTSWIFRAGPIVSLAAVICAGLLVPLHAETAPLAFSGDVIAFAYLFGLARFFTIAAALDTGSAFEGMGASREAAFAAFAEPALFVALASVCIPIHSTFTFDDAFARASWASSGLSHPTYLAAALALFAVLLAENSRIPVDDPNTHLELTMIHEVMVLDHGGPDLAFILYGAAMKLFVAAALLVHVVVPVKPDGGIGSAVVVVAGVGALAVAIGVVESLFARLRMSRVPQFLLGALVLAAIGLCAIFYASGDAPR